MSSLLHRRGEIGNFFRLSPQAEFRIPFKKEPIHIPGNPLIPSLIELARHPITFFLSAYGPELLADLGKQTIASLAALQKVSDQPLSTPQELIVNVLAVALPAIGTLSLGSFLADTFVIHPTKRLFFMHQAGREFAQTVREERERIRGLSADQVMYEGATEKDDLLKTIPQGFKYWLGLIAYAAIVGGGFKSKPLTPAEIRQIKQEFEKEEQYAKQHTWARARVIADQTFGPSPVEHEVKVSRYDVEDYLYKKLGEKDPYYALYQKMSEIDLEKQEAFFKLQIYSAMNTCQIDSAVKDQVYNAIVNEYNRRSANYQ